MNKPLRRASVIEREQRSATDSVYLGIIHVSKFVTYTFLLAMMFVMVLEVIMRYALGNPLGWNISLIENILLPGVIFFGLPWAYKTRAHVAAEMVYDRLRPKVKTILRWLATLLVIVSLSLLVWAGTNIAIETFQLGSKPPPLSSQIPISTWVWRTFLPLGAMMTLILMILDMNRDAPRTEDTK